MSVPHDLADQIMDLYRRIAELERRQQNSRRSGTVHEVDYSKKLARVNLGEDADGSPFLSPWVPWKTSVAGTAELNVPPSVGQQVDVTSESGDIADGVIESSSKSDTHPLPAAQDGEYHYTSGDVDIHWTKEKVTIKAPTIVLEGAIELGAAGASRELALRDTVTTDGAKNISSLSTKVKAV